MWFTSHHYDHFEIETFVWCLGRKHLQVCHCHCCDVGLLSSSLANRFGQLASLRRSCICQTGFFLKPLALLFFTLPLPQRSIPFTSLSWTLDLLVVAVVVVVIVVDANKSVWFIHLRLLFGFSIVVVVVVVAVVTVVVVVSSRACLHLAWFLLCIDLYDLTHLTDLPPRQYHLKITWAERPETVNV